MEWFGWIYGKVGHWGFLFVLVLAALILAVVWLKAVDGYKATHEPRLHTGTIGRRPGALSPDSNESSPQLPTKAPVTKDQEKAEMSNKRNPPNINVGPGGAVSINQQGGITAGTVNIGGPIPVDIDQKTLIDRQLVGNSYKTEIIFSLNKTIPELQLQISSPSIQSAEVSLPHGVGGILMKRSSHDNPRMFIETIQNASGSYKLTIIQGQPDIPHIGYATQ